MVDSESEVTSVSLHVFMERDGEMCAVCQIRGKYNFEDPERFARPESWAGALQPLVHGGVKKGEIPEVVACREAREEVGGVFVRELPPFMQSTPLIIGTTAHYSILGTQKLIDTIQFHNGTGGIDFVRKVDFDAVVDVEKHFQRFERIPRECTAMFAPDIAAMKKLCP